MLVFSFNTCGSSYLSCGQTRLRKHPWLDVLHSDLASAHPLCFPCCCDLAAFGLFGNDLPVAFLLILLMELEQRGENGRIKVKDNCEEQEVRGFPNTSCQDVTCCYFSRIRGGLAKEQLLINATRIPQTPEG